MVPNSAKKCEKPVSSFLSPGQSDKQLVMSGRKGKSKANERFKGNVL